MSVKPAKDAFVGKTLNGWPMQILSEIILLDQSGNRTKPEPKNYFNLN